MHRRLARSREQRSATTAHRKQRTLGAWLGALATCAAAGSAVAQQDTASGVVKIVDGVAERGRDAVVFVNDPGGRCTGAIIGQRLVLTAKHCVQAPFDTEPTPAADISVGVGFDADSPDMEFFRVADVVVAGGAYTHSDSAGVENLLPDDVAVLTLQHSPGVQPLGLNFADPESFVGSMGTAVGFGQTPDNALGGVKMSVATKVQYVDEDSLFVGSTVCPGDSGGPLIDENDQIIGVVSQGLGEECGVGVGFYNRIDLHEDLVMQAFARAGEAPGECVPTGAEVCDGFDNDCDGEVDEDCLPLGSPCSEDEQCIGGLCADTPMGRLCAASCDPLQPAQACPDGLRCINTGQCEGLCVPGSLGGKDFNEPCERDEECASLFCADPGDGNRRCLGACRSGTDGCFADEACIAPDGACGPCAEAGLVSSALGFGEPCDEDERCRSEMCIVDGDVSYCSTHCDSHGDCPASAHCRQGSCVRGSPSALGGRCMSSEDCSAGMFCTTDGSPGFCTLSCESEMECGDGFECRAVTNGQACVPVRGVLGSRCESSAECISNFCDDVSGRCSRACSQNAACGSGFHCVRRKSAASGICLTGAAEDERDGRDGGGCSAAPNGPLSLLWGLAGVGAVLGWRRRGT